ncbi:MAG: hypothetical protein O2816_20265, partial [Planctomycetota bacterium]|nr:hypothetical protein [Planctomycetota bacterium]
MLRALPLLLLLAAYAAAGQEMEWRWAELPQGFQLDLTSGQVADAGGEQRLTWEDGLLACSGTLARWQSAQAGPAERVTREGAVPVGRRTDAGAVQRGSEWIFDIGDEGWGYLRVLSVKEEALSLEWSWAPASQAALERRPGSLRLRARGARIELDWQAEEGETYLVERRVVGDGSTFRPLARVRGERTLDQAPPEGLLEYRVRQLGRGPGLGTSRRTVYGAAAGDQPLEIVRGMTIDLLCGTSGAPSADLEVVHLTAQSISLRPLDGTLIHPFAQTGSMPWSLPAVEGARYVDAVRTLSTSAVVAVYLREQVY